MATFPPAALTMACHACASPAPSLVRSLCPPAAGWAAALPCAWCYPSAICLPGDNQGRTFLKCAHASEQQTCLPFIWEDEWDAGVWPRAGVLLLQGCLPYPALCSIASLAGGGGPAGRQAPRVDHQAVHGSSGNSCHICKQEGHW